MRCAAPGFSSSSEVRLVCGGQPPRLRPRVGQGLGGRGCGIVTAARQRRRVRRALGSPDRSATLARADTRLYPAGRRSSRSLGRTAPARPLARAELPGSIALGSRRWSASAGCVLARCGMCAHSNRSGCRRAPDRASTLPYALCLQSSESSVERRSCHTHTGHPVPLDQLRHQAGADLVHKGLQELGRCDPWQGCADGLLDGGEAAGQDA